MLPRADRRLLRVRRPPANAVARFRWRPAGARVHRRILRPPRSTQSGCAAMNEVTYAVVDVSAQPYSVTPVLTARVGVASVGDEPVHAIALRCQVRIDPLRRRSSDEEAAGLLDLFGPRERWSTTQRTFVWLHCDVMVPGFSGATQIELPLEC